jgi:hypothetical protein
MKLSNLISKFHQTFARVLLAFNLFDSLFPHHAAKLKQNHQVNLKNSEPTQSKNDAAQAQFEVLETGVMRCWSIGPNYTWCAKSVTGVVALLRILAGCAKRRGRIPAVVFDR